MFRNQALMRVVLASFVTAVVTAAGAAAQTTWKQGRTPDGQPDLQGIWLNFDSTPFEAAVAAAGGSCARRRRGGGQRRTRVRVRRSQSQSQRAASSDGDRSA